MKKTYIAWFAVLTAVVGIAISARGAQAQMMSGWYGYGAADQAATSFVDANELRGQTVASQLQNGSLSCLSASQDQLRDLGDYYMGRMMGSSHGSMDQYIQNRYGQDYLDDMHLAMGERFSGCDASASFPAGMMGFAPMMGGYGYGMMGWNGYGGYGGYSIGWTILCVLLFAFAAIGLVTVIRWLARPKNV